MPRKPSIASLPPPQPPWDGGWLQLHDRQPKPPKRPAAGLAGISRGRRAVAYVVTATFPPFMFMLIALAVIWERRHGNEALFSQIDTMPETPKTITGAFIMLSLGMGGLLVWVVRSLFKAHNSLIEKMGPLTTSIDMLKDEIRDIKVDFNRK